MCDANGACANLVFASLGEHYVVMLYGSDRET